MSPSNRGYWQGVGSCVVAAGTALGFDAVGWSWYATVLLSLLLVYVFIKATDPWVSGG